jgi:prepilin-type N-terminal cleavage/methylation domain-containing protein
LIRRAFTLTELLVVITIIAILAGMAGVAVVRGLDTAKQTRIKAELDSIDAAFKAYKEKYGSYPPCNLTSPTSNTALRAHIARAFPRYTIANLPGDLAAAGVDVTNFRPDQALVFWLQGFSQDPVNPFVTPARFQIVGGSASGTAPITLTPLFNFDPTRMWQVAFTGGGGGSAMISPTSGTPLVASYYPQGTVPPSSSAAPYLYFDSGSYGTLPVPNSTEAVPSNFNSSTQIFSNAGVAVPYWSDLNGNGRTDLMADANESWANVDSFQLISAGTDGQYGNSAGTAARLYPTGTGYDLSPNQADDDNITNFCAKARLGDAKP